MRSWIPCNLNYYCQKELKKIMSWSFTIDVGNLWTLTILDINSLAAVAGVQGWRWGMKWQYLESRSTITMTAEKSCETGRPSIKSIEISVQTWFGIGNGWSNSAGFKLSSLNRRQTTHSRRNFLRAEWIPGQVKFCWIRERVLSYLKCPPIVC